jgi:hypothetical protein
MSVQYFIAKTVQDNQYVVLLANKIVAGLFLSVAEAVRVGEGCFRVRLRLSHPANTG